ncbi:hypothetical protein [Solidesulfovibrio sp.]|uniref:hypothetical protein n=1 Tax=Solidesulfovibrio sp. TaxID=2910990 RepID=UPI002633D3E3|nr:hypothetical protein [Solidesulfovibrio sp.]
MDRRRGACRLVRLLLRLSFVVLVAVPSLAAAADDSRWTTGVTARSLGFRDMREPLSFTPSAPFIAQRPGWSRDWSEERLYAFARYALVDTDALTLAPGFHLGTSVGRFTARNREQGYYESWETRPALLWGPSLDLVLRRSRAGGLYFLARYELFLAAAAEAGEQVRAASGTATPPSARDAFFSWTSHEVTAAVGYDWGKVAFAAGLTFTAFRLDKRLTHHVDPAAATGNALAAILALDTQASRYGYEPRSLIAPFLSATFRPLGRWSLEASLRPAAQPDAALTLSVGF